MLVVIELHKHDFGVSVEKDLLVDTSNAFNRANIGGILCAQIARMLGFNLALHFFFLFAFL